MSVIEITTENFEKQVEQPGILVIDFWASWCGPCRQFAPIFEAAAAKHTDITWGKCNTDEQQELARGLRINSIPTLMVFRDDVLLFAEAGVLPPAALDELVTQVKGLDMEEVKRKVAEQQAGHVHGPGCHHDD